MMNDESECACWKLKGFAMSTIRATRWPEDIASLSALATTLETERIYRPVCEGFSFRLIEENVNPPMRKNYPFNPSNPLERQNWDYAVIAEEAGNLAGFAAAQYMAWNRRVILWHLYVAPNFRRQGIGTLPACRCGGFRAIQRGALPVAGNAKRQLPRHSVLSEFRLPLLRLR